MCGGGDNSIFSVLHFAHLQMEHPAAAAGAGPPPDPADGLRAHLHPAAPEQTGGWAGTRLRRQAQACRRRRQAGGAGTRLGGWAEHAQSWSSS